MTEKLDSVERTPEEQLQSFLDRFDPAGQELFRSVRAAVRQRFPTANELAYDYNHSVVIAYSPTERGIEGIVSISLLSEGVRLYFTHGPQLPDPKRLLLGSAKQVRFVRVEAASQLADPDVEALMAAARERASVPLLSEGKGRLVIKSEAAKKRPRPKPAK
jgi:hypothetical protein